MSKKFYGEQQKQRSDGYTSLEDLLEMARNGSESNRELIIQLTERMGEFKNKHNELVRLTQKISDRHNALGHFVEKDHDDLGTLYNIKDSLINRIEKLEQAPGADTSRLDKLERAVRKNRKKTGKQAAVLIGVCGLLYAGFKAVDKWQKEIQAKTAEQEKEIRELREETAYLRSLAGASECAKAMREDRVSTDSETESDG